MLRRRGKNGEFWSCREYPRCTHTAPVGIGIDCPRCGAPIVERTAKKSGRPFWPCSRRECEFIAWAKPHRCGACGAGCVGAESERPRLAPAAGPDPAIPDRDEDGDDVPF
jgi:DNA topoisomerase-1